MDLEKIYYNPSIGFTDLNKFYDLVKKNKLNYTYKQISDWYNSQNVNEVYKQHTIKPKYQSIIAVGNKVGTLQMDLLDIKRFKKYNMGVKYLLNIIDVYSRYLWCYPIKSKKPDEIKPYIQKLLKYLSSRDDYDHLYFTMDSGSEFKSSVKKLFDEYDVKLYIIDPDTLNSKRIMSIVERVNRTLWNKLKKYMFSNDTLKYIDVLDQLVYNYNHTTHSTTKQQPYNIMNNGYKSQQKYNVIPTNVFQIGDKVRHLLRNKTFSKKAFNNTYSLKVYTIKDIINNRYVLNNDKVYDYFELIKASNDDNNDFSEKVQEMNNANRYEKLTTEDFKMPIENVEKQMTDTKRKRKQTNYYIHNY
jgi:hypothetical protein